MNASRAILLGLCLGLLSTAACDEPAPPTSCVEWLQCYVGCRDGQYRRGEDDTVPPAELHGVCIDTCIELANDAPEYPFGIEDALGMPRDDGYFWGRMHWCVTDGDVS